MPKSQGPARASPASQRVSHSQGTPRSQPEDVELKELARTLVRFLLTNDFDKVPIKQSDIVKNVTKNSSRSTAQVIKLAEKMFREVYGLKLVTDDSRNMKQYFLVNAMKNGDGENLQGHISLPAEAQEDLTLLSIVLSLIFMMTNGRLDAGVEQVKVNGFLQLLGIDANDHHEYFGNVKKKFENFKAQRYLDVVKIENTDPVKMEYRWGIRASEEMSPRTALEFATLMYGRENIDSWKAQFKAVQEYERVVGGRD